MTECIHGLDAELCDLCTPRKREEPVVAPVARPAAARRAPVGGSAIRMPAVVRAPGAKRAAPAAAALPDIDLATMRVHHWTHLSNLADIFSDGRLRADAVPELDVASPEVRERRAAAALPTGSTVAGHVPFALSPDAATWNEVRSGAEGSRWSPAARATRPTDFVVLVAPVAALPDDFVLADGDPAGPLARFGVGQAEAATLARRASIADPDLLEVEILVPDSFDLSLVTLIGVPNDRTRDEVKSLLRDVEGRAPRVAVYPPWFRPSEAE